MGYSKKNRAVAAELIAKATQDLQFRKAFIDNAKALLIDAGAEFDDDVEIRVVENTDKIRYVLLPALPTSVGDLSDEQMAQIAGGSATGPGVIDNAYVSATAPATTTTMNPVTPVITGPSVVVTMGAIVAT